MKSTVSDNRPLGEGAAGPPACIGGPITVDCQAGKAEVQRAWGEAVTPLGQPLFFVDYLKQADLFDPFVGQAPLTYAGRNRPQVRYVLGTLLPGASRYAYGNARRHDGPIRSCWA